MNANNTIQRNAVGKASIDSVQNIQIETQNLLIKPFSEDDFENCVRMYGQKKLMRFFDSGRELNRDEVRNLVKERGTNYSSKGYPFGLFSIFLKKDKTFIGQIDLLPTKSKHVFEIGCILLPSFHKSGYAFEAGSALIDSYIPRINVTTNIENFLPIKKIIITTHPKNFPVIRTAKKLGFLYESDIQRFDQPRKLFFRKINKKTDRKNSKVIEYDLWEGEQYNLNSSIQYEGAKSLISKIPLEKVENILDVGCGDGKISVELASLFNTNVVGIDKSPHMIQFAKEKYSKASNIEFCIKDGESISYVDQFDIIFSSFVLQWITDLPSFIEKVHNALHNKGLFCSCVPLGISDALESATKKIILKSPWNKYIDKDLTFLFDDLINADEFFKFLKKANFNISLFEVSTQSKAFKNIQELNFYISQWFPYLKFLPKSEQEAFMGDLLNEYKQIIPEDKDGSILFSFPKLEFIASKSISNSHITE